MGGQTTDQMLRSARGAANFVGADSRDTRNFLGYQSSTQGTNSSSIYGSGSSLYGSGRSGQSNLYGSSMYGYGTNRYGRSGYSSYGRRTTTPRSSMDLGFDYAGAPVEELSTKVAARLTKTSTLHFPAPLQVSVENGTAQLRGSVASEHQRALAEQLALLEPGVRRVDNQLTVEVAPTASQGSQAKP
jgi:osmotically-inducible protein OsmY